MTLAQSLGVSIGQHVHVGKYAVYVLRSFRCQACKTVLWSVLHQVGSDSDFIFDPKIVCNDGAHAIQDRHIGEDANIYVTWKELTADQAVAHLKKRLPGRLEKPPED